MLCSINLTWVISPYSQALRTTRLEVPRWSLLPISEYDALFSLIGTIYGGDGQVTFALPNLQSRVAIHAGTSNGNTYVLGEMASTESIIITQNQMPAHSHPFVAASGNPPASSSANSQGSPAGNVPSLAPQNLYNPSADGFGLAPAVGAGVTAPAGGSQPVSILSPLPGHELYHCRIRDLSNTGLMIITNYYK